MNVARWCGSFGSRSSNAALLAVAAMHLGDSGAVTHSVGDLRDIPCFDPALADAPPSAVEQLRRVIRSADALLIAAPEYAAGIAGSTKNALDWLVGDATVHRKIVGVASAGTTGGPFAIEQLVRTLAWHGAWVVATLGVSAPRTKTDAGGAFTDHATQAQIRGWVQTVVDAAHGSSEDRAVAVAAVARQFGIDPARFGDIT